MSTPATPRVLLVDDDAPTLRILELLLRREGFQSVFTARCGREALALTGLHAFDIVISDLGLPDISGLELIRQIRAVRPLRAILVSGLNDVVPEHETKALCDAALTKPVEFDALREAIVRLAASTASP